MLQVREQDRVVYLRVSGTVGPGLASTRLASELIDACQAIEERAEVPVGVALLSDGPAFWVSAPDGPDACDALSADWAAATAAVGRLSPPTIAAVGATAIGPAWELALACDLRLAANDVRVGCQEVALGRIPAAGGTQRLARLVGPSLALRLVLFGEVLTAPEALDLGLIHRLAPSDALDACLGEVLAGLRASAPLALAYAKETVRQSAELSLDDGLRLEADLATLLHTTLDRAEGIDSFLRRRAPRFEGR
jgi:enoyl-CoA hydratase